MCHQHEAQLAAAAMGEEPQEGPQEGQAQLGAGDWAHQGEVKAGGPTQGRGVGQSCPVESARCA